jgi:hypothetical protein
MAADKPRPDDSLRKRRQLTVTKSSQSTACMDTYHADIDDGDVARAQRCSDSSAGVDCRPMHLL